MHQFNITVNQDAFFVAHFFFYFFSAMSIFIDLMTAKRGRPPKGADYEPKIRTMMRLAPELHKGLKTAVRRKRAKSANAYHEEALRQKLIQDGILKPDGIQ